MPRYLVTLLVMALGSFVGPALAQAALDSPAPLDCGHGPVSKSFGGVPWLAYACSDGRSVVLMSAPGSPAMPFYFMFSANGSGHRLIGEGTGSKAATDRAYKELKALSEARIQQIFAEAMSAKPEK